MAGHKPPVRGLQHASRGSLQLRHNPSVLLERCADQWSTVGSTVIHLDKYIKSIAARMHCSAHALQRPCISPVPKPSSICRLQHEIRAFRIAKRRTHESLPTHVIPPPPPWLRAHTHVHTVIRAYPPYTHIPVHTHTHLQSWNASASTLH